MSINTQNSGGIGGTSVAIQFIFGDNCWVKGTRILFATRAYVGLYTTARCTIRDNYFYGSDVEGTSLHYGVDTYGTADNLVENNIVQHRASPFVRNGEQGSVFGYNFSIDDCYGDNPSACFTALNSSFFQASQYSHEAGNAYILDEGNIAVGIKGDIIHGPSNMFTFFRNSSKGYEAPIGATTTQETGAVKLYARNRYWNFIGNVLGTQGYHTTYQADSGLSIYAFGMGYNSAPSDSRVTPSTLRWGNWDNVTSTNETSSNDTTGNRWACSEVPTADSFYTNACPGTDGQPSTLPSSFYLSSRPTWFGYNGAAVTWPPIGPDVTGGNVTSKGGHVYKIPAQLCWENSANDPAFPITDEYGHRIKIFDPATCYASVGAGVPSAPTNFRIIGLLW